MIYNGTDGLGDLEKIVRKTCKVLRQHLDEFDVIVVQGMSGVIVGAPVSLRLKKPLVVVRKEFENTQCHSSDPIVNSNALRERGGIRWVFLDDFTCMGVTRSRCAAMLKQEASVMFDAPAYAGCYLYRDNIWEGARPEARYDPILSNAIKQAQVICGPDGFMII
jgi:hypothetical protein